ncbi:MAG: M48 family metallopeptidase [Methylobacteriaceae bacterium]|jgi:Zn-dependent protease with chaperone function|nr:M48 family metallopeptidase [Methylobacteriaceae bacterium]
MAVAVTGIWYDAGADRECSARLLEDFGILRIEEPQTSAALRQLDAVDVRIHRTPGGAVRRVEFADGSEFEAADANGGRAASGGKNRGARADRSWVFSIGGLLAAAAGLLALYLVVWPAFVTLAVDATPPVLVEEVTQSVTRHLTGALENSRLPAEEQARIFEGFHKLAALTSRGAGGYELNFRGSRVLGPNAFALPNGQVFLLDDLVDVNLHEPELILAVLAHEVAHIEKKHALRGFYDKLGIVVVGAVLLGGVSSAGDVLAEGIKTIVMANSQQAEMEADRYSADLLYRSGYDPVALMRSLSLVERQTANLRAGNSVLRTHPPTPERVARLKQYIEQLTGRPVEF